MVKTVTNSAKQCHIRTTTLQPLQHDDELHQKDLRINLEIGHIWDPENEAYLRADMFLALSLIVAVYVPGRSY